MTDSGEAQGGRGLSPDEAFATLGNETRVRILRVLGEAEEPLSFTELRDRVGIRQGGQFNYHLEKVVGHFVSKTDEGYRLDTAGRRVVEAVLSGAVTESPVVARTRIDWPCELCGAPVEMVYEQERVERYCTECAGTYGEPTRPAQSTEYGYLGAFSLPTAGFSGRSPLELQQAAAVWGHLEVLMAVVGVCPRCSARVEYSLRVCEAHDATDGRCDQCDNRHAVWLTLDCPNCIYDLRGAVGGMLVVHTELQAFLAARGLNLLSPSSRYPGVVWDFDEEVLGTDPLSARYTFTVDGDAISLTVGEELDVVDVTTSERSRDR